MLLKELLIEKELNDLTLDLHNHDFSDTPELAKAVEIANKVYSGYKALKQKLSNGQSSILKLDPEELKSIEQARKEMIQFNTHVVSGAKNKITDVRDFKSKYEDAKQDYLNYKKLNDMIIHINDIVSGFFRHGDIRSKLA